MYIILTMEEKEKFYTTLCNNHNVIIDRMKKLKKTGNAEVKAIAQECLDFARYCKKQGQHMENRLKKYRNAVESLGFTRKGKFDA